MNKHEIETKEPLVVPAKQLSPQALNGLIEEFVTRSGTDYGQREATLAEKCSAIRKQLLSGRAVIIADSETQTCNIVPSEDIQNIDANRQTKGAP